MRGDPEKAGVPRSSGWGRGGGAPVTSPSSQQAQQQEVRPNPSGHFLSLSLLFLRSGLGLGSDQCPQDPIPSCPDCELISSKP